MSTKVFLTNIPMTVSGVSGTPLLAAIGTRGSLASASSLSLATTNTTAGVTTTTMTLTAGGANAVWITRPIEAAVTVSGTLGINFWSLASAVAALSNVDFQIFKYSTTLAVIGSTAIATSSINIHPYLAATRFFVTLAPTSTAFVAGDRIVIIGNINPAGGIAGASQTVTLDYNGTTQGADGDAYIEFNEDITTTARQNPELPGSPSIQAFETLRRDIAALSGFSGQLYSPDARLADIINEIEADRDLGTA